MTAAGAPGSPELDVRSSLGDYSVDVGDGALDRLLDGAAGPVVCDERFEADLAASGRPVVAVEAREEGKTVSGAERLLERLRDSGASRDSHLVAVGGGVVQDLTTFAAGVYMRGIPWSYAPTTLVAMVDSCIGGKSSLNAGGVKNLAGNYHPPRSVAVDPRFAATLGPAEVAGGLCEAAKICWCRGPREFERHLELAEVLRAGTAAGAAELAHHTLSAKAWFIERDEFDRAERRQLNFGHTFAHALESATGYTVPHGVAVGVGVLAAVRLGAALGRPAAPGLIAFEDHVAGVLADVEGLGSALAGRDDDAFARAFAADKKHPSGEYRVILPAAAGGVEEVAMAAGDESLRMAASALARAANGLGGPP